MAFPSRPGETARRRLAIRLREVAIDESKNEDGESTVVRREADGPLLTVDRAVLKTEVGSRLALLIEQSGVQTTPGAIIVASFGAAGGAGILAALFVPYLIVAPVV